MLARSWRHARRRYKSGCLAVRSRNLKGSRFTINREFEQNMIPYGQPGFGRWIGLFRRVRIGKNENQRILLIGGSVFSVQFSVFSRGGQLVHAASWATNRTHRRLFAQLFWRTCRPFTVDGAEILNQVRRFSMPRASIAETCRIQGRRRRWIVARSIEQTDAGQRRRRQILRSPLFTPVYGCSRDSVGVPSSPTERTATGATARSTYLWKISRSGDTWCSFGIRTLRETTDR